MVENDQTRLRFASPPCLAGEIAQGYLDPLAVDPQQARDVARWRTAERSRLRAARKAMSASRRADVSLALRTRLRSLLARLLAGTERKTVSLFWPVCSEPDLRPLMTDLARSGVPVTLPVVEECSAPLLFRAWTPATRLERGLWSVPVPGAHSPELVPDIVVAPLLGWDRAGYRLGYGGGTFDRTLAARDPRPHAIGVGLREAELATIYPQPHDIPFDHILTEDGVVVGDA